VKNRLTCGTHVTTSRDAVESFRREIEHRGRITLWGTEARDVLTLALSTFSDAGTTGASLDEELCSIDEVLEKAGYEPGNAVGAIAALARRAKRWERLAKGLRRPKKKARTKRSTTR
jgi:hypothetical protein